MLTAVDRAPPLRTVIRAALAATTPGQSLDTGKNLFVHGQSGIGPPRTPFKVAARLEIERGDQGLIHLVTQFHRVRVLERAEEKAGSHEEHEAHGDLKDDERTAHPRRRGHRSQRCLPPPKCRGRIPSKRLKDWGEPEEQPASNTNDERKAEDARVHGEVNSLRNHEGVEQRRATRVTSSAPIEPRIPRSTDSVSH